MERQEGRQIVPGEVRKTSWITNMVEVSEAAREARRSKVTWESIVEKGVRNFMRNKGMITMAEEHPSHVEETKAELEEGEFWDSVSGVPLIPQLVMQAREEEMKEFRKHDVYSKVPIRECLEKTGRTLIWVKVG